MWTVTLCDPLSWRVCSCLRARVRLHTDQDDLWPEQPVDWCLAGASTGWGARAQHAGAQCGSEQVGCTVHDVGPAPARLSSWRMHARRVCQLRMCKYRPHGRAMRAVLARLGPRVVRLCVVTLLLGAQREKVPARLALRAPNSMTAPLTSLRCRQLTA